MAHCGGQHVAFLVVEVDWKPGGKASAHLHPTLLFATTAANGRDVDSGPSGVMSQRRGCVESRCDAVAVGRTYL